MQVFWVKLRQRGYSRSIMGSYRVLRCQDQMAVKVVPTVCIVGDTQDKKFYQYLNLNGSDIGITSVYF